MTTVRHKVLWVWLAVPLVGLAADTPGSVSARSLENTRRTYRFDAPLDPRPVEPASEPAADLHSDVIQMPRYTVVDSYANRVLARSIEVRRQKLVDEEFDWVRGGRIHRHTGRTFTVDLGIWSPGSVMELVRVSW